MGLLRHRSASVVLTDIAGRTTEIRTGDIKELRLAPASLMPAGIDQALSPQELADLIVFLKSLK
jgi:hypothetical protein